MARRPLTGCTVPAPYEPFAFEAETPVAVSAQSERGGAQGHLFAIRCLYVLPSDGDDRGLADDGTLCKSVAAMQTWFYQQTGCRLRFLSEPILTVRLTEDDAENRWCALLTCRRGHQRVGAPDALRDR